MSRQRSKPTTNEYYRSVLDNALREQWQATKEKTQKKNMRQSKMLSSLYGYSMSSSVVKDRLKIQRRTSKQESAEPWVSPRYNVGAGLLQGASLYASVELEPTPTNVGKSNEKSMMRESKSSPALNSMSSKAWYMGYQNSVNVPPGSSMVVARRYGHTGALNITRQMRGVKNKGLDLGGTSLTLEKSLPRFLGEKYIVDEYQDALSGPPGKWPTEASYVMGSNLKAQPEDPKLCPEIIRNIQMEQRNLDEFNKSVLQERHELNEQKSLNKLSRYDIPIDLSTMRPKDEHNKIIQNGKNIRYLKSSAMICETKDLTKSRIRKSSEHEQAMLILRWRELQAFSKQLRLCTKQQRPVLDELKSLLLSLKAATTPLPMKRSMTTKKDLLETKNKYESDDESLSSDDDDSDNDEIYEPEPAKSVFVTRDVFVQVLQSRGEIISRSRANKLFSSFDIERLGEIDYRPFVAAVRALYQKTAENAVVKLTAMFEVLNQHYDSAVLRENELYSITNLIALNDEERRNLDRLSDELFGSTLRSRTHMSEPGFIHAVEFTNLLEKRGTHYIQLFNSYLGDITEN